MTDNNELPKWVKDSLEKLKSMTSRIQAIKKQGQAETRRGLEKMEEANRLQTEADYLDRVLSRPHESPFWSDEIIAVSGIRLANSISFLEQSIDQMASIANESGEVGEIQ